MHTCYSPVRRSPADEASSIPAAPRLACVKPVASVHPEPGSNSSLLYCSCFLFSESKTSPSSGPPRGRRGQRPLSRPPFIFPGKVIDSRQISLALVLLLYLVYCKPFQCSLGLRCFSNADAKLRLFLKPPKLFGVFFVVFFRVFGVSGVKGL